MQLNRGPTTHENVREVAGPLSRGDARVALLDSRLASSVVGPRVRPFLQEFIFQRVSGPKNEAR